MRTSLLALFAVTASLLAACSSSSTSPTAFSGDRPGQTAPRYDYLSVVPLQSGDTEASVQQRTGGTVLAWNDTNCAAGLSGCQALVGLNGQLSAQRVRALSTQLGRAVTVEPNKDQYATGGSMVAWAGGSMVAWAGGSMVAWAGGSMVAWAGGTYQPIPQNNAVWNTLHLQQAQALAPNLGAGVTVAVIDTGIDLNHPAFQGALTDPSTWWDFYAGDPVPQDEGTLGTGSFGHGTNVAGIVLQIAPKAKIMPIRVLGPDGSGDLSSVASAINWAVAKGANVINISLGSLQDSQVLQTALRAAAAQNVLVVSSAGNTNSSKLTFPAGDALKIPGLLSVGSVDPSDVKSSFSNFAQELEVVAPGENVYAPAPSGMLAAWTGTSQAAPMATGALALLEGELLNSPLAAPVLGAVGSRVSVPVAGLLDQLGSSGYNVYQNPLNKSYKDKLGQGRLDLSAYLSASLAAFPGLRK